MKNLKDYFSSPKTPEELKETTIENLSESEPSTLKSQRKRSLSKKSRSKKRKISNEVNTPENSSKDTELDSCVGKVSKRKRKRSDILELDKSKKSVNSGPQAVLVSKSIDAKGLEEKENDFREMVDQQGDSSPKVLSVVVSEKALTHSRRKSKDNKAAKNEVKSIKIKPAGCDLLNVDEVEGNGNSTIEDSVISESEEMSVSLKSDPGVAKSLLNYFNKVEKTFPEKKNKTVLKVEALVHTPPAMKKMSPRPNLNHSRKKKASRALSLNDQFDEITSEENADESSSDNSSDVIREVVNNDITCSKGNDRTRSSTGNSVSAPQLISSEDGISPIAKRLSTDDIYSKKEDFLSKPEVPISTVDLTCAESGDSTEHLSTPGKPIKKPSLKSKGGNLASYFGLKVDSSSKSENCREKPTKVKLSEAEYLARQQFLESSLPECVKKRMIRASEEIDVSVEAPFPKVSHTRQSDRYHIIWNLCLPNETASWFNNYHEWDDIALPAWSNLNDRNLLSIPVESDAKLVSKQPSVAQALKSLSLEEKSFPVKLWHKILVAMHNRSQPGEIWTEKYRPRTCSELPLNGTMVDKLADWLAGKVSSCSDDGSNSQSSDSDGSRDEFVAFNSNDSTRRTYSNTALLIGPHGSGKTAAVYAAAKQNGYQVLELNASCNRNGKKILNEFSEATQSHKVETKSLLKTKRNKKKQDQSEKNSLILIEDAELVYTENGVDEGYIASLNTLQVGSKRPLILIINSPPSDPSAKHVLKLAPSEKSSLRLEFKELSPAVVECFLKTVSIVEKQIPNVDLISRIVKETGGDIRWSLLNLQFAISGGKKRSQCRGILSSRNIIKKLNMDKTRLSGISSKMTSKSDAVLSKRNCEILSNIDLVSEKCQAVQFEYCSVRDSTILEEDSSWRRQGRNINSSAQSLCEEMASYIYGRVHCDLDQIDVSHLPNIRNVGIEYERELGEASTLWGHSLSRHAIASDYMPSLRRIARTEKLRQAMDTKRNNRFFNYLAVLGLSTDLSKLDRLTSALSCINS